LRAIFLKGRARNATLSLAPELSAHLPREGPAYRMQPITRA
jgi:hypothetical protein